VVGLYKIEYELKLTKREQLLIMEIDTDKIDAASKFVDYINDIYNIPKSSIWYMMKKLKEEGLIEFASRDEIGKPLYLTDAGIKELDKIKQKKVKEKLVGEFRVIYNMQQSMV